jgi:hypothetical protein
VKTENPTARVTVTVNSVNQRYRFTACRYELIVQGVNKSNYPIQMPSIVTDTHDNMKDI